MAISQATQGESRVQQAQPQASQPQQPAAAAVVAVRRYHPGRDHAAVVEVCRNVYGGTDELPATINSSAQEPGTHILVAATGGEDAELDALLCCQQRGDVLWLWGARTREDRRGLGLTTLLLEEAEVLGRSLPGVAALLSVTVPANETMRRIFQRRGFQQQCQIVTWPASRVVQDAHSRLQEQLSSQGASKQQHHQRQQLPSLLSVLPEVATVADSAAARSLLPHWRQCRSQRELAAALLQLRQPRSKALAEQQPSAAGGGLDAAATTATASAAGAPPLLPPTSHAFLWLPGEYEVLPAGLPQVQHLIEQGQVWLLEQAEAQQHQQHVAGQRQQQEHATSVLVHYGPGFRGVQHAGIVAGSASALEAALLLAAEGTDPSCCRFYVDCCGRFDHDALWNSTGCAAERYDILPFYKPL